MEDKLDRLFDVAFYFASDLVAVSVTSIKFYRTL